MDRLRHILFERRYLIGLVVLFLGLRAALVLALADVFFHGEELSRGAVARALLDDLPVATHELAYTYYNGGEFVFAHLVALAFEVCGPSLLALKLVALIWGSVLLCAGCSFCDRLFGRPAAVLFGLFFVFAPATFQKMSLLCLGIHFEAILFVVLTLHFGGRILFAGDASRRTSLLLGVSAGFGCYFSYPVALAVAFVAVALALRRAWPRLGWCALGLLSGLAPWLYFLSRVGGQVFDLHVVDQLERADMQSTRAVLVHHGAAIFGERAWYEQLQLALLPVTLAAGVLRLPQAPAPLRRRILFVLAYGLSFLAVYVWTFPAPSLVHYFRLKRLSQVWFFAIVLAAALLGSWLRNAPRARLPVALAGLLVLSGALDTLRDVRAGRPATASHNLELLTRLKGYRWEAFLKQVEPHFELDEREKLNVFAHLADAHSERLSAALAHQVFEDSELDYDAVREACRAEGGAQWSDYLLGLGGYWRGRHGPGLGASLAATGGLPPEERSYLRRAVARESLGMQVDLAKLRRQIDLGLERGFPEDYFVGLGHRMADSLGADGAIGNGLSIRARPWVFHPEVPERFLAELEPGLRVLLRRGYERGLEQSRLP